MTDTSKAAVANAFTRIRCNFDGNHHDCQTIEAHIDALSAQLAGANQRCEMLQNALTLANNADLDAMTGRVLALRTQPTVLEAPTDYLCWPLGDDEDTPNPKSDTPTASVEPKTVQVAAKDAWTKSIALEKEVFTLREAIHSIACRMEGYTKPAHSHFMSLAIKSDELITLAEAKP